MGVIKDITVRIKTVFSGQDPKKGFDEIEKGSKKAKAGVDKLQSSLLKMGASLGAAFAVKAVITNAIQTITQFDQSIADLGAITGKTGKELSKFKQEVLKVSQITGKSAVEIAKAFQLVGSAQPELLKSAAALGEVTKQAILLSQAGGIDVVVAAEALTKAMNQFGASASDAAKFTDILATSQQKGTATIAQLSESLKNVGAVANAAGLSFEETNVALQALAKGGLTGAEAGTGLRAVLSKLSIQSDKEINPSLTSLADVVNNLADKNLTLKSATKLVGEESAKSLLTLIDQNRVVQELTGNLNETGNAMDQAATRMDTITGKQEKLATTWDLFILSLDGGDSVIGETFKGLLDFVTKSISGIDDLKASADYTFGGIATASQKTVNQFFKTNKAVKDIVGTIDKIDFDKLATEGSKTFKTYLTDAGLTTLEATRFWNVYLRNRVEQEKAFRQTAKDAAADLIKTKEDEAVELTAIEKKRLRDAAAARKAFLEQRKASLDEDLKAEQEEGIDIEDETNIIVQNEIDKNARLKEERQKDRDERREERDLDMVEKISRDEELLSFEQAAADAKKDINNQLILSSLGLAAAVSQAVGDSQDAQIASLTFEKAAAVASIIINTQVANARLAAELGVLSPPAVLRNNILGAVGIASVLAQAIPTAIQIVKPKDPKRLKDGEVMIQGAGTETSDSIPALLSKNESIINAKSSKKHTAALKAINDDRFEDYLNRVMIKQMYVGGGKRKAKDAVKVTQDINVDNISGAVRVTNPSAISRPLLDALEESKFLNENNGWG